MKILTADDSKTIRKIIKGGIETLGHECVEAENGRQALELLEQHHPDVGMILLDLNMPEMGGFEVLEAIQDKPEYKDIPVMMVTTESEKNNITRAISMGAKHYITKPFSSQDLTTRITECLGLAEDLDLDLSFEPAVQMNGISFKKSMLRFTLTCDKGTVFPLRVGYKSMIIRDQIIAQFDQIENLPTFPETVQKVMAMTNDPESSAADIAKLIEYDQATSAAVLKLANSAYYNPAGAQIGNIKQAIARLGMDEIRKICMAFGAIKLFVRSSDLVDIKEFWKHSISVALTTRVFAKLKGKHNEEQYDAFTSGLFHDVGIMIFDQYFHHWYSQVRTQGKEYKYISSQDERKVLGIDHGELGAMLLRRWNFPSFICDAVEHHHEPGKCPEKHKILCQTVHLADFGVASSGLFEPGGTIPSTCSQGAWFAFDITVEQMQEIISDVSEGAGCAEIYTSLGLR